TRIGLPIHSERPAVGGARADHAQAAVVVDVGGLQREPGKLAAEVGLLICHRRSAEEREGVFAVSALNRADGRNGLVERLVPARVPEAGFRADERSEQAVGMIVLQVAFHTFGTKLALIDRELFPRLEADYLVVFDLELNATLDAAKATMRFHEFVLLARVPDTRGCVDGRRTDTVMVVIPGYDQMRNRPLCFT